jgi:hypothetical protein
MWDLYFQHRYGWYGTTHSFPTSIELPGVPYRRPRSIRSAARQDRGHQESHRQFARVYWTGIRSPKHERHIRQERRLTVVSLQITHHDVMLHLKDASNQVGVFTPCLHRNASVIRPSISSQWGLAVKVMKYQGLPKILIGLHLRGTKREA